MVRLQPPVNAQWWRSDARDLSRIAGVLATLGGGSLAGLAGVLLAAHLYSPAAMGFTGIALSGAVWVNVVANLGIIPLLLRRAGSANQPNHLVNLAYTIGGTAALLAAVAYSWLIPYSDICSSPGCHIVTRSSFVVLAVAMLVHSLQDATLFALDLARAAALRTFILQAGRLVLIVTLSSVTHAGIVLATAISYVVVAYVVHRKVIVPLVGPYHVAFREWKALLARNLSYLSGNYLVDCLILLPSALVPMLIAHYLSIEQSGLYYVASLVFSTALLPVIAIVTAELASQAAVSGGPRVRSKALALALGTAVAISIVLFGAAPTLLAIFGTQYQTEASFILRMVALAAVPYAVSQMFLAHMRLMLTMTLAVAWASAGTIVTLGLTWLLIQSHGLAGVGIAIAASNWFSGVLAALLWWRSLRATDPARQFRAEIPKALRALQTHARAVLRGL